MGRDIGIDYSPPVYALTGTTWIIFLRAQQMDSFMIFTTDARWSNMYISMCLSSHVSIIRTQVSRIFSTILLQVSGGEAKIRVQASVKYRFHGNARDDFSEESWLQFQGGSWFTCSDPTRTQ